MKIYVHHYYTYEIFWYFFHASNPDKIIPTWFAENRFNKTKNVERNVEISFKYDNWNFTAIFCGNNHWTSNDGYHVWDYNLYHYENKTISDRGWNLILGRDLEKEIIPKLNKYNQKIKNKISIFFIDWEYGVPGQARVVNKSLNKEITIFKDELIDISDSQMVSFTHILWSFVFPNTINLREYFYFSDYLKYKNDYKYKVNYPVRRLTTAKYNVIKKISKLNNKYINSTVSSFTDYYKHDRNDRKDILIKDVISDIGEENVINKRGYNLDDFGGEWNDNNMNEFMWKLLTISDINFIHEVTQGYSINEKSFSHILANKPFISTSEGTYSFYNEIFKTYGYDLLESPTHDMKIEDKINHLDFVTRNKKEWNNFYNEISSFIENIRKNLLNIMNTRNGYLDYLIKKESEVKTML